MYAYTDRSEPRDVMDYQAIFARIRTTVDARAYMTPAASVDPAQRHTLEAIQGALRRPEFDISRIRADIRADHASGAIDRVMMLSALHVVACHPRVADWEEAARLVGEQEFAALELGGPRLQGNLASVDRHRGVLAFLRGHYDVALDYFARALERQRSSENLQNILCTLIRLGDESDARELLNRIRGGFPVDLVHSLDHAILNDPDLALLRDED